MGKAKRPFEGLVIDPGSATGLLVASVREAFHATMDLAGIGQTYRTAYPDTAPTMAAVNEVMREYPRLVTRWNALDERRRIEVICLSAERGARAAGDTRISALWKDPMPGVETAAWCIIQTAQRQLMWGLNDGATVVPVPAKPLRGATAVAVAGLMKELSGHPAYLSTLEWLKVWVWLDLWAAYRGAPSL